MRILSQVDQDWRRSPIGSIIVIIIITITGLRGNLTSLTIVSSSGKREFIFLFFFTCNLYLICSETKGSSNPCLCIVFRTYFIVAGKMVRPGTVYRVAVTVLQAPVPLTIRANIQRNGVELSADSKDVKEGIPETLLMRVSRSIFNTRVIAFEFTFTYHLFLLSDASH